MRDLLAEAEATLDAARESLSAYNTDSAEKSIAQVLDLVAGCVKEDPSTQARALAVERQALISRAWVVFEREGLLCALNGLETIRAEAGPGEDSANCDIQAAMLLGRSGEMARALGALRRADGQGVVLPPGNRMRLLLSRGALASQLMELTNAREDLSNAVELSIEIDQPKGLFMAMHNLGYVEYLAGDLPTALRLMTEADALDVDVDRSESQLDRGRVLLEAGLVSEAHGALEGARSLARDAGSERQLGEIDLELVRAALLSGNSAEAIDVASRATRGFLARAEGGWRRRSVLATLEAMGVAGQRPRARARLASALREVATQTEDQSLLRRSLLVEAQALVDLGDTKAAKAAFHDAEPLIGSPLLSTRLQALWVAAQTDSERAREWLEVAAGDIAATQKRAAGLDVRTAMAVHSSNLASMDVSLAHARGPADVIERAEVWRDLAGSLAPSRPPHNSQHRQLLSALRRAQADLRSAVPGEETEAARIRLVEAELAVRSSDWSTSGEGAQATSQTWRYPELQERVDAEGVAVLMIYVVGGLAHGVAVLPGEKPRGVEVGDFADLSTVAQTVRGDLGVVGSLPQASPLRAPVMNSLKHGVGVLDRALLGGLPQVAEDRTPLVIVPPPQWLGLPFSMFPSRVGLATSVSRSASAWARGKAELVANPQVMALSGPQLALGAEEVRSVREIWTGQKTSGGDSASIAEALLGFAQSDLVHVAAHGEHHAENPLFSTLQMADGPLFAHDLEGQPMRSRHVVLSSCHGGVARARGGQEALGMTASLLELGATTVVGPVSAVPEAVAASTMVDYHRGLAAGVEASQALADAVADADPLAGLFSCFGSQWQVQAEVRP